MNGTHNQRIRAICEGVLCFLLTLFFGFLCFLHLKDPSEFLNETGFEGIPRLLKIFSGRVFLLFMFFGALLLTIRSIRRLIVTKKD
jgi:TRAP-type C4-dicarboxylate transport system permease small subunit